MLQQDVEQQNAEVHAGSHDGPSTVRRREGQQGQAPASALRRGACRRSSSCTGSIPERDLKEAYETAVWVVPESGQSLMQPPSSSASAAASRPTSGPGRRCGRTCGASPRRSPSRRLSRGHRACARRSRLRPTRSASEGASRAPMEPIMAEPTVNQLVATTINNYHKRIRRQRLATRMPLPRCSGKAIASASSTAARQSLRR